jgi:hypothetical protein
MNNLTLTSKEGGDFKPHPEGIHPACCVDVMDLGMVETEFQGERRVVPKVRVVFESEQPTEDGRRCTVSKNFTASLHPKAKLAEFLGKWRGRPVVPGETIDLAKLIGASCTLVISHQQNPTGRTYASIDAVSKPTRKVTPSGHYDPAAARQRYAEWSSRTATGPAARGSVQQPGVRSQDSGFRSASPPTQSAGGRGVVPPKSGAPVAAPAGGEFDPEVGF